MVIAFRGTQSMANLFTNAQVIPYLSNSFLAAMLLFSGTSAVFFQIPAPLGLYSLLISEKQILILLDKLQAAYLNLS